MAELHRRTVGNTRLIEVDASPNGSISAPKGSLALDSANGAAYVNTDGATAWTNLTAGGGPSFALAFGANGPSAGNFLVANGEAGSTSAVSAETSTAARHPVPAAGTITALAWVSSSADATTDLKVFVNGTLQATVDLTGANGVVTGLSISVAAGDRVAVEYDAGTAPGSICVSLLVE